MGLTHSNICTHCTDNIPDDYAHVLWFCAPVQKFWLEVCEDLSTWLKCSIPACPTVCILGDLDDINMETNSAHMVLTVLCITKENYSHELESEEQSVY